MNPWNDAAGAAAGSLVRDVNAVIRWDPDGPGPKTELLVFGGRFTTLGGLPACGIVAFDPATGAWLTLEGGVDDSGILADGVTGSGVIYALAAMPDGRLIAGGVFSRIGSAVTNNIAQYDGASWKPMLMGTQPGYRQAVRSLLVLPSGDIVAGGCFKVIGTDNTTQGPFANGVSRWDGSKWNLYRFGLPRISEPGALALAVDETGLLFAGGEFTTIGPFGAQHLACFRNGDWDTFGGYGPNDIVTSILPRPGGKLLITGAFNTVADGRMRAIAYYTGGEWSPLPSDLPMAVTRASLLAALPNGRVGAVVNGNTMAEWDEVTLRPWLTTPPLGTLKSLVLLPGGDVLVTDAGTRTGSDGVRYDGIAVNHDGAWRPLQPAGTPSPNGVVNAVVPLNDGRAVAVGRFDRLGDSIANVAIFDGRAWSSLGTVGFGPNTALVTRDGRIIVAGARESGSTTNISVWNGTSWTALGSGTDSSIYALTEMPNGDIVVGGSFRVAGGKPANSLARWNGNEWFAEGVGANGPVNAIMALASGDLVVGGSFNVVGPNGSGQGIMVFRNGVAYPMGAGIGPSAIVTGLAVSPSGELYAVGLFSREAGDFADGVARWTGTAWVPGVGFALPSGPTRCITFDDQARMVLGGRFTPVPGGTTQGVIRIDSQGWKVLGDGLNGSVVSVAAVPGIGVLTGGTFSAAGNLMTPYFARFGCLDSPCVADFDADTFLTTADFDAFVVAFEIGMPSADLDHDGQLTFEDFDTFVMAFETGC